MPELEELSGPGQARHIDPITSKISAEIDRTTIRGRVLEAICEKAGIADELIERTGIDYRTLTPRLAELKGRGMIRATGEQRMSHRNRPQLVHEITFKGYVIVKKWWRD